MKSFIKLLMIIFVMTISFFNEPSALYAQTVDIDGSIKNIKTETITLVSNNLLGGEVFSSEEENTTNYIGSSTFTAYSTVNNNLSTQNLFYLDESFIHNLSTNTKKVHQIRAP